MDKDVRIYEKFKKITACDHCHNRYIRFEMCNDEKQYGCLLDNSISIYSIWKDRDSIHPDCKLPKKSMNSLLKLIANEYIALLNEQQATYPEFLNLSDDEWFLRRSSQL